jgi:hypothetical protein
LLEATHKLYDLDWLVRRNLMNGFVTQLQNSNAAIDTDEKQLQIESNMSLKEGALGGTPQKRLKLNIRLVIAKANRLFLHCEYYDIN